MGKEITDTYKLEPLEELPDNMKIHAKYKGRVPYKENMFIWEVNGVMLQAEDMISAQRKYLRAKDAYNITKNI